MKRMKRTIIFNGRHGLHFRPASEVVRIAFAHESKIIFASDETQGDARSIFELLFLGIKQGDLVEISVVGHDAEAAMDALCVFLDSCLEQGESFDADGSNLDSFAA